MDERAIRAAYRTFRSGQLARAVSRYAETEEERVELLAHLIRFRENERDRQLRQLRNDAAALLRRLDRNRHTALVADIACYKDVMRLHRLLRASRRDTAEEARSTSLRGRRREDDIGCDGHPERLPAEEF